MDRLADAIADGAPADFMEQFAFPLPVSVICQMLGLWRWGTCVAPCPREKSAIRGLPFVCSVLTVAGGVAPGQTHVRGDRSVADVPETSLADRLLPEVGRCLRF
jgi:hypothetical protein